MKKILGLIGALGLTTSTIATGISASPVQNTKIKPQRIVKDYPNGSWVSGNIYGSDWRMFINPNTCRWLWSIYHFGAAKAEILSLKDWRGVSVTHDHAGRLANELLYTNNWYKFDWGAKNGGLLMYFSYTGMINWQ